MEKMYVSIKKEWFEKNRLKLEKASDENDSYVITTEDMNAELNELSDDNELFIAERMDDDVYVSLDYTPKPETIVALVENAIDDIKGESFVAIIEVVVKKLNKFKSLIESIRGL